MISNYFKKCIHLTLIFCMIVIPTHQSAWATLFDDENKESSLSRPLLVGENDSIDLSSVTKSRGGEKVSSSEEKSSASKPSVQGDESVGKSCDRTLEDDNITIFNMVLPVGI